MTLFIYIHIKFLLDEKDSLKLEFTFKALNFHIKGSFMRLKKCYIWSNKKNTVRFSINVMHICNIGNNNATKMLVYHK